MNHRLFHTLVLGSGVLLGGSGGVACMARVAEAAPGTRPPDEAVSVDSPTESPSSSIASGTDAGAPRDAASDVLTADARACESGWPTTKGMVCTSDGGPDLCCQRQDEAPVCCPRSASEGAP